MEGMLASIPQQMRKDIVKQDLELPPELAAQLSDAPVLFNLARSLAYHRAMLEDAPLAPDAVDAQREYVHDATEMLRTILCL